MSIEYLSYPPDRTPEESDKRYDEQAFEYLDYVAEVLPPESEDEVLRKLAEKSMAMAELGWKQELHDRELARREKERNAS